MRDAAPIAVTGIGVVSAVGVGCEAFWNALRDGKSGVAPVEGLAAGGGLPTIAARVRDFAARDLITSAHYRRMDGLSRMVVASSRMALADAGLTVEGLAAPRVGVVFGSAIGDISESGQHLDRVFEKGPAAASPMMFPNLVLNAPASYVAMELGVTGVNLTVAQAEVSGEQAIALGCDLVRAGACDVVLAGAGDELAPVVIEAAHRARGLAAQRGGREWASPYDSARSGVVLGEGAAVLLLEPLERARARGARVYAGIAGIGTFSVAAPEYDWPARIAVVPRELGELSASGIDLICGGANSSRRLDACELELFGRLDGAATATTVTSIKGAIGEFGAAGALTAAAACLAVHHQAVPPLPHLRHPLPVAPTLRLAGSRSEPRRIDRALVCGLARGGAGAALLLERAPG